MKRTTKYVASDVHQATTVASLLATMQTPWRFRTKRNLWAYAVLAVVTWSSADHTFVAGQPVRRRRAPLTGGSIAITIMCSRMCSKARRRPPPRGPVRCRIFTMSWWPGGCGDRGCGEWSKRALPELVVMGIDLGVVEKHEKAFSSGGWIGRAKNGDRLVAANG